MAGEAWLGGARQGQAWRGLAGQREAREPGSGNVARFFACFSGLSGCNPLKYPLVAGVLRDGR